MANTLYGTREHTFLPVTPSAPPAPVETPVERAREALTLARILRERGEGEYEDNGLRRGGEGGRVNTQLASLLVDELADPALSAVGVGAEPVLNLPFGGATREDVAKSLVRGGAHFAGHRLSGGVPIVGPMLAAGVDLATGAPPGETTGRLIGSTLGTPVPIVGPLVGGWLGGKVGGLFDEGETEEQKWDRAMAQHGVTTSVSGGGGSRSAMPPPVHVSVLEPLPGAGIGQRGYRTGPRTIAPPLRDLDPVWSGGSEVAAYGPGGMHPADFEEQAEIDADAGTVICTALYTRGLISREVYEADAVYGGWLWANDPEVLVGYRRWGRHVARWVENGPIFARVVAFLARPWASEMARRVGVGGGSVLGDLYMWLGIPFCRWLGRKRDAVFVAQR